ncbi:MAG TPA: hypothetical protein VGH28_27730 [Polyangiaceae bacterium]
MRLFRREWIVPALALVFVSASAQASRDELSAQAAGEMQCNSVSVMATGANEYLATGCGKDWTYTCEDDGACSSDDATRASIARNEASDGDDEAAEEVASALTDLACACASAGMSAHGSHHSHTSSEHHHEHKNR